MPALPTRVKTWIEGLRFPVLLLVTGVLFVINLFVPDPLPFVDEALLALVAVLLSRLKRHRRLDGERRTGDDRDHGGSGV
jgi:hypothetical protein